MSIHTTNYTNTFIEVAEDCPVTQAEIPVKRGDKPTIATLHFEMIYESPYKYTSDEVIFNAFAIKNNVKKDEIQTEREKFFSKGQPCMRTSPLTKRYGFGVHYNSESKMAIFPIESETYQDFLSDPDLLHLKAMRTKKA